MYNSSNVAISLHRDSIYSGLQEKAGVVVISFVTSEDDNKLSSRNADPFKWRKDTFWTHLDGI